MKQVIKIIEKLRELSGNEQLEFLKQNSDNKLLKEVLEYTYNPDKMYKINEAKLLKAFKGPFLKTDLKDGFIYEMDINIWDRYKKCLDELVLKKGVKDSDISSLVKEIFLPLCPNSLDLAKGILLKDLRLGLNVKTLNKVFPKLFTTLQVQLANKFDGRSFEKPYYSRKFDGSRVYIMDGLAYSRTNKLKSEEPIQHILNQLRQIKGIENSVLDGEMLYFDENGKEDFQKGISLTSKDKRTDECKNICYVIFDVIPKDYFINQEPYLKFKYEYQYLIQTLGDKNAKTPCYSLIGTKLNNIYIARQDEDISKLSELRDKNNWEGLMVREGNASYEYKRTNNLLKIKKMQDNEFKIVGFKEGTGRLEGTLGNITIKLITGEEVDVGSGYSDEDRKYIWENQEKILNSGYLLKVQYFEETKDKNGQNSLRFPVFKAFRKNNIETMRV